MAFWKNIRRLFVEEPPRVRTPAAIDITNSGQVDAYRAILAEIISILRDSGFEEEAKVVQGIMSYLDNDGETFARYVAGPGIWGSLGFDGAASCNIASKAPFGSDDAFRRQQRLYELLAELANKLKADGMYNPKVESLGEWYAQVGKQAAQPGASPNGGPAEPSDNSEGGGGPPSVS